MGELKVIKLNSKKDKAKYIHHLLRDIEALEIMIQDNQIEKNPIRIGVEQEFCLVNSEYNPNKNALDVLEEISDNHFTTEIGSYNLELNLDPIELKGNCFSDLHKELKSKLGLAKKAAEKHNTKIILTGILPTLALKYVKLKYMTPIQRYSVINDAIKESRKQDFDIHIKGVDELNLKHSSVMLEGCNTSFQMHLQINPDSFVDSYNWAQAISGPILSACANSPLLFGKELWKETRIALFTQSVDTRANSFMLNEKQSRVSFGNNWATGSITDIFKDNISRFRSLVSSEYILDSVEMLNRRETPKLKALNLHNGTVYPWNRPCYGVSDEGKPHLRIENRYIPSGPTIKDEIANLMFWVGVMLGKPKKYDNIHEKMNFKDVKSNFFNAARYGMAAQFYWNGKYQPSKDLILDEFLPLAYRGLYDAGISPNDVEYYLTIIENRVKTSNGSQWIIDSYRNLLKRKKPFEAAQTLVSKMYSKQESDFPVSSWQILDNNPTISFDANLKVKHKMTTNIFSVDENDSVELVINIMKWKNIHHMPVINSNKDLIGLISWTDVEKILDDPNRVNYSVDEVMKKELHTITQYKSLEEAKNKMKQHNIHCLPVVYKKQLLGIITSRDL
ncbi:CBS domain-containing protein [Yeosuana sp. MJ-SS3]|uniref:CBS domain-containing protein n=1 Tax=Gilvirhabdus luticola TaxID=3079858 RepID=A0ABU3U2S6_9FLAO|nr:CBS domain-containing protein [Yeosuana sp. MJ-SS3]MDU8884704.1 CBS domain-containing protein [Yeosuana sp. MJ-SS3]